MYGILIIIGLIIIIIGLIYLVIDLSNLAFLFGIAGAYLLSGGILMYGKSCKPTAMDVYRGKTTLKIIYKDSIPVDSIVVFKDNKK